MFSGKIYCVPINQSINRGNEWRVLTYNEKTWGNKYSAKTVSLGFITYAVFVKREAVHDAVRREKTRGLGEEPVHHLTAILTARPGFAGYVTGLHLKVKHRPDKLILICVVNGNFMSSWTEPTPLLMKWQRTAGWTESDQRRRRIRAERRFPATDHTNIKNRAKSDIIQNNS